MSELYDLVVIGGGPGGYAAAMEAAQLGKRVALVEKKDIGGTCCNRGCIPTKALLHCAELKADTKALCLYRDEAVSKLRLGMEQQLKKAGVEVFCPAQAQICGEGSVEISYADREEKQLLMCENIVIAAGGEPVKLDIEGIALPGVMDSDSFLALESMDFKSAVIIGGGVIGIEFAQILENLGCHVTIIEGMKRILPGFDREMSQAVKMSFKKYGTDIYTDAKLERITGQSGELTCHFKEGEEDKQVTAQCVICAVGRRCDAAALFASEAALLRLERGRIVVDENYETDIKGIYAVGDITTASNLAHAATAAGKHAVNVMFGMDAQTGSFVPSCLYTRTEAAAVGMTLDDAKQAGIDAVSAKYPMSANGKSVASNCEYGYIRLTAVKSTGVLLGAQLVCERATDIIGMLCLALEKKMTVFDIAAAILPHPTYCEGVGEAAALVCRLVDRDDITDYERAVSYVKKADLQVIKPGLDRVQALLDIMGNPQNSFRSIHITGTNGKGSTAAMLAEILKCAGYKTGLFSSPYLERINEYMRVDGECICDEEYMQIARYIRSCEKKMTESATEFERSFAMAAEFFKRHDCDICVIEVGMGGTGDATNIIPTPIVSVFTHIGIDHVSFLGNTIEAIAKEKSGIIKPGCQVVCYPSDEKALDIIRERAQECEAPLRMADFSRLECSPFSLEELKQDGRLCQRVSYKDYRNIELSLLGRYQQKNLAVVLETVDALRECKVKISEECVREALSHINWPGRFEVLCTNPLFIADGGHNVQCMQSLVENFEGQKLEGKIVFIIGVMADKDYKKMLALLKPYAHYIVGVQPDNSRALDIFELGKAANECGIKYIGSESVNGAVKMAMLLAKHEYMICAAGSLYMMKHLFDSKNLF